MSYRQTKTLVKRFREHGAQGIASKRRGKPSNNRIPDTIRKQVMQLIRVRYSDFGPTLAAEKLLERHLIKISRETLRKWLLGAETTDIPQISSLVGFRFWQLRLYLESA